MIRNAEIHDLPQLLRVYAAAKRFMIASGNPTQWAGGYPEAELLQSDIEKGQLFLCEREGRIRGVFAFILGADPTYGYIEDGKWPNEKPYGTIHRIASDGETRGVFTECFQFALSRIPEIRIDTHHDNKPMQHVVTKHGFIRCGIIYLENGDPRIAYQYSKD